MFLEESATMAGILVLQRGFLHFEKKKPNPTFILKAVVFFSEKDGLNLKEFFSGHHLLSEKKDMSQFTVIWKLVRISVFCIEFVGI